MRQIMLIQAPADTHSGYGAHSRDIIKSLFNRYRDKYDIIIRPMGWGNTPHGALDINSLEDEEIFRFIIRILRMAKQPLRMKIPVIDENTTQPL